MVANQPISNGGSDELANRLAALERKLNELGRQNKFPFAVSGPGGSYFRVTNDPSLVDSNGMPLANTSIGFGDGRTALEVAPGTYGGQQVKMYDSAGSVMYRTDEYAGYGLSAPILTYFMGVSGNYGVTANVEAEVARCEAFWYNPSWYVKALVRVPSGTGTWTARLRISDGTTTVYSSSTGSNTGDAYVQKCVLLPASFMNAQGVTGLLMLTPSSSSLQFNVFISASVGQSKAAYDLSTFQ